jgi:hypothetical protein
MNSKHDDALKADAHEQKKRAYVAPAFRHEPVFEVMALACGKVSSTQAGCAGLNRKLS